MTLRLRHRPSTGFLPAQGAAVFPLQDRGRSDGDLHQQFTGSHHNPSFLFSCRGWILLHAEDRVSIIYGLNDIRNASPLGRICEGDEWQTAFNIQDMQDYTTNIFRLTNAPAVFQALVNDVLRDMINRFVFVYVSDICIFWKSPEEHVEHVLVVLQQLLENSLFVKGEKCEFNSL